MPKKNFKARKKVKSKIAKQKLEHKSAILRLINSLQILLKKKKREQSPARNEFRFNFRTGHPNYIFEEDSKNKKYAAVGLTHEKKTFGKNNMPLKNNPKKSDTKPAYVRNGIIDDEQRSFSRRAIKNMQFSKVDMQNVKSKIRKHKSERRKKGKKKEARHAD